MQVCHIHPFETRLLRYAEQFANEITVGPYLFLREFASLGSLNVWRSNISAVFIKQAMQKVVHGKLSLTLPPGEVLTLTTTTGQQKGSKQLAVSIQLGVFLCL